MLASLYTVILLEGFIVLSMELLAIRQLLPFVGSGTDVVAIVIAAVLMPLSFGYYAGGKFKTKRRKKRYSLTVRRKLIRNVLVSSLFFLVGFSYVTMIQFFDFLKYLGVENELLLVTIYSAVFLVYPVFMMAQTIPLVSNFFKYMHLPTVTGKVLFVSTIGSFLGSIVSTLILMNTIGVHNTVIFNFLLIAAIVFILARKDFKYSMFSASVVFVLAIALNNDLVMKKFNVVENNAYSLIQIEIDERGDKLMKVNHSKASKYAKLPQNQAAYVNYIESFIAPTLEADIAPLDILVLGAGGFSVGWKDHKNTYTYVDIDKSLKEVSEKYFLDSGLGKNKTFVAKGARAFLNQTKNKYDLVIVDLYSNAMTIPSHLITHEFYKKVKESLNKNAIVLMNVIASPLYETAFSRKIDATIRSVLSPINRQAVTIYSPWNDEKSSDNLVYVYRFNDNLSEDESIYTDNLNTYFMDK